MSKSWSSLFPSLSHEEYTFLASVHHIKQTPRWLIRYCAQVDCGTKLSESMIRASEKSFEKLLALKYIRVMTEKDIRQLVWMIESENVYTVIRPFGDMFPRAGSVEFTVLGALIVQVVSSIAFNRDPSHFTEMEFPACYKSWRDVEIARKTSVITYKFMASTEDLLQEQLNGLKESEGKRIRDIRSHEPTSLWRRHWWQIPQPMWWSEVDVGPEDSGNAGA